MEVRRVEKVEFRRAVAEDQVFAVLGQSPAFVGTGNSAQEAKRLQVVDERRVRLPGELDERVTPVGKALAEVTAGQRLIPDNAARLQVFFAQRGTAAQARTFVYVTIEIDKPLGEGVRVVWIGVDDAIGVGGLRENDSGDARPQQKDEASSETRENS